MAADITEVDQKLLDWAAQVAGNGSSVSLDVPSEAVHGIHLYLFDLAHEPAARGVRKPPLQVMLRYLVTVAGADAQTSHRLLWALILDAKARQEKRQWTVDLEPAPLPLWQALGVAPMPSFFLRIPLRYDWPVEPPPTAKTVEISSPDLRPLHGIVRGPEALPVVGALVSVQSVGVSAYTDGRGRFLIPSVPWGPRAPKKLVVRAKGLTQEVALDLSEPSSCDVPIQIEFQLTEP